MTRYRYVLHPGDSLKEMVQGLQREQRERRLELQRQQLRRTKWERIFWTTVAVTAMTIASHLMH